MEMFVIILVYVTWVVLSRLFISALGTAAVLVGAYAIWSTVRRINDRDDPRYERRSPDAP